MMTAPSSADTSDLAGLEFVTDFREKRFSRRGRRRCGGFLHRLGRLKLAEQLHHPENCEPDKMVSFMTLGDRLVIEFPLKGKILLFSILL